MSIIILIKNFGTYCLNCVTVPKDGGPFTIQIPSVPRTRKRKSKIQDLSSFKKCNYSASVLMAVLFKRLRAL